MAQFYASIKGSRGEATRMGTKNSGLSGHIRGWHIGCRVELSHFEGEDYATIFLTHGSASPGHAQCLGRFKLAPDGTFEQIGASDLLARTIEGAE